MCFFIYLSFFNSFTWKNKNSSKKSKLRYSPLRNLSDIDFVEIILLVLYRSHEQMSVKMIDYIVDQHHIDIETEMTRRIQVSICSLCGLSPFCFVKVCLGISKR